MPKLISIAAEGPTRYIAIVKPDGSGEPRLPSRAPGAVGQTRHNTGAVAPREPALSERLPAPTY
jgi:hypothetical protein